MQDMVVHKMPLLFQEAASKRRYIVKTGRRRTLKTNIRESDSNSIGFYDIFPEEKISELKNSLVG